MKARKRRIPVVMAVMLAFALVTVNAVPVLADEVVRQSMEENAESVIMEDMLSERQENPESMTGQENAEVPKDEEPAENAKTSENVKGE